MHEKFAMWRASGYVFRLMARYYSGQNQPLGTWNNLPIYLTTIITAVFVVGLVGSAILTAMGGPLLDLFGFTMPLLPSWSVWRLFSYVFVDRVSFFTPFSIMFFYWASVGIETHLGRIVLTRLLLLLALVVPAVAAFWWWMYSQPSGAIGGSMLLGGLIVAFATLYPNTEAWGWIPFKWMAFACIACGSLMLLAAHDWLGIAELWISCAVGFGFVRNAKEQEYDDYVPLLTRVQKLFHRKPKFRVVPSPTAAPYRSPIIDEPASELDVILDKIAKSGMSSLTDKERAQLQKAREALIRKDQR
jgi:hypothetical protein